MRRSLAPFSGSESSIHTRSWADFITTTSGFRFSVHTALYAVIPAYVAGLFSARVRYSAISISYTVASGIVGGLTPLLATALYVWAQHAWPVGLYLVVIGLISMVSIYLSPVQQQTTGGKK